MFKSIATQTGNYSYSLNMRLTGFAPFEVGFSGTSEKIFSFTGQSGKIFDEDSNFFYSYDLNSDIRLSGNRCDGYNNYFINNNLINSRSSQGTGYLDYFYTSGPISTNITFNGVTPNFTIDSGVFRNNSSTGNVDVFNNSPDPINFKIYSGIFSGPSGNFFSFSYPFDSGNISDFKSFSGNWLSPDGLSGIHPVTAEFYTNFGTINRSFNIYSIFELESYLSLSGPSFTDVTGFYDYTLDYDLIFGTEKSTSPYGLTVQLKSISGKGDLLNIIPFTGYISSGNISVSISNGISESGQLTGNFLTTPTGYNTGLLYDTSGLITGLLESGVYWATGLFLFDTSFLGSGRITGNINTFLDLTGEYEPFTSTGLVLFTGQGTGYLDLITGFNLSGYWDYDNRLITTTGNVNITSSGINPLNVVGDTYVNFNYISPVTGVATGNLNDSVTVYPPSLKSQIYYFGHTGYAYYAEQLITGQGILSGLTGSVTVGGEQVFLGNGSFTGTLSGVTGVTLDSEVQTNIISTYTGVAQNIAEFSFISHNTLSTGYTDNVPITSFGKYLFTGSKYNLTGQYYAKIESTTAGYNSYETYYQSSQNLTGFGYYVGQHIFSGTGFYIGDCTGIGYTGAGLKGYIGTGDIILDNSNTGFYQDPFISGSENFCIPLSGSRWFDNPLEISGNSGIALIYNYTDRIAPELTFSSNDSARTNGRDAYPFCFRYKWMNGATTILDDVDFSFSPYYYASGTGIYMDRNNALTSELVAYTGIYPLLTYITDLSITIDDGNGWSDRIDLFNTLNVDSIDANVDTEYLFVISNTENVRPSGFFYMFWRDNSSTTQNNPTKTFNTYLGDDDYNLPFITTSALSGFMPSVNPAYPTGIVNNVLIQNNVTNFKSGNGADLPLTLTGLGTYPSQSVTGRYIYFFTGNLDGYSQSGSYFSQITGYQVATVNTGLLDDAIFYYDYVTGFKLGQDISSLSAKHLFSGRVSANYSVEQWSGDLSDKITGLGFNLFLETPTLYISGEPASSTVFGLGLTASTISAAYNNYQSAINTLPRYNVTTTGISYVQLEFPTLISGFTSGTFSGSSSIFLDSDWTGAFRATGLQTGVSSGLILDGTYQLQTGISFNVLFSGDTGSIDVPSKNSFEALYNWTPLTGNNWTGDLDKIIFNTGNHFVTGLYTGSVISGSVLTRFTGEVIGEADITGVYGLIQDNSGTYHFTGIQTGFESTIGGANFSVLDDISGVVKSEIFSGVYNFIATGTGIYTKTVSYYVEGIPFAYYAPSYIKSFTGEYSFYSGVSTGNLIEIPYDEILTGYSSGITITGENSIALQIFKKKYYEGYPDKIELFYSGDNNTTGSIIVT